MHRTTGSEDFPMDRIDTFDAAGDGDASTSDNLCSGCVACCHAVVSVTHVDLARLAKIPRQPLSAALKLYSEEEFDCDKDDPDMAILNVGRRMLALRTTERGCKFLQKNGNCGIYEYRPRACRSFPYEIPDFDKGKLSLKVIPLATELNCKRAAVSFRRSGIPRAHVQTEEVARVEFRGLLRKWDALPIPRRQRTMAALIKFLARAAKAKAAS